MSLTETKDLRSDLHMFLRIVEAGSLRAVAQEFGVQPSAVSRRLAKLEARLGVRLLQRSTAESVPTDAGTRYYEELHPLLEQLDVIEARARGIAESPAGLLRVAAPADFGTRFVAPALGDLSAAHPELRIQLLLASGFSNLVTEGIDVAIRVGHLSDSSLVGVRLGSVARVLVAAPAYLERRGTPRTAADLEAHDFVFYGQVQERARIQFEDGAEVGMTGRLAVNSAYAVVALVERGHGIHLGPRWAFQDLLESGKVVQLLPDRALRAFPLHALRPEMRFVPAKTRAVIEAMREVCRIHGLDR